MSYETLKLEQNEAVLTITVNRPEALNAQSRIMLEDFDRAMAEAATDDSVKVVIDPAICAKMSVSAFELGA